MGVVSGISRIVVEGRNANAGTKGIAGGNKGGRKDRLVVLRRGRGDIEM